MTTIDSPTPRLTPPVPAPSTTIYRDTPLPQPRRPVVRSSVRALVPPGEHISDGILFGLATLMLPTVLYSLAQALGLISSGSLEHAIRAFIP